MVEPAWLRHKQLQLWSIFTTYHNHLMTRMAHFFSGNFQCDYLWNGYKISPIRYIHNFTGLFMRNHSSIVEEIKLVMIIKWNCVFISIPLCVAKHFFIFHLARQERERIFRGKVSMRREKRIQSTNWESTAKHNQSFEFYVLTVISIVCHNWLRPND